MKTHVVRLKPKQDLKKEILALGKERSISAGCIITCVGSLERLNLRYAHQEKADTKDEFFEILSLVGTFSENSAHLHLCVADKNGKTIGGHLLDGNLIFTTAEIVVGELPGIEFLREHDETYGYRELVIHPKPEIKS